MPKGDGRVISLWVKPQQEPTIAAAHALMLDLKMSFTEMVAAALEDYVTLHQHCAVNETRVRVRSADYDRQRRANGL